MNGEKDSLNSIALRTLDWAVDSALSGIPGMISATELAQEYLSDSRFTTSDERVNSLIRWHALKNGGLGVISGALGVINTPAALGSIAASLGASWLIQARLAGAIALIYGHNLESDRVRTAIMWVVLGDSANAAISTTGKSVAEAAARVGIKRIPNGSIKNINKLLGRRVITKFGEKGIVNLGRLIPLVGAVVGGAVDGGGCYVVGKAAKLAFKA